MGINKERMIEEFIRLVEIDSPSFKEGQMARYIEDRLQKLGISVSKDTAGNLYGYWEGTLLLPPLLFSAHMDTVEPAKGKKAVVGEDEVIRSGGATVLGADDCSGIAAILEAIEAIKEQNLPHRPLELLFTVAEEVYCKGVQLFDTSKIKAREAYILDLAGPVGSAAYQAPTILAFTASITGRASHAGFAPEEGIHAIAAAADAIGKLPLGRIGEDTTLNVGVIEGGLATNIVPDLCVVRGEVRSFTHEKAVAQIQMVKEHFEMAAKKIGACAAFATDIGGEAYKTPLDHPVVRRFEAACAEAGILPLLQKTFGGSDNNYFAKQGIFGLVVAPGMNLCHSCEEYTTTGELCEAAKLTLCLMSRTG